MCRSVAASVTLPGAHLHVPIKKSKLWLEIKHVEEEDIKGKETLRTLEMWHTVILEMDET